MKIFTRAMLILGIAALGACASVTPPAAEERVRERAQLRLDLLTSGGWKDAYLLSSPSYRAVEPVKMYSSRYAGAGLWITAEVKKVVCDEAPATRCEVDTEITYKAPSGGFVMPRVLKETWILVEDDWYKFEE